MSLLSCLAIPRAEEEEEEEGEGQRVCRCRRRGSSGSSVSRGSSRGSSRSPSPCSNSAPISRRGSYDERFSQNFQRRRAESLSITPQVYTYDTNGFDPTRLAPPLSPHQVPRPRLPSAPSLSPSPSDDPPPYEEVMMLTDSAAAIQIIEEDCETIDEDCEIHDEDCPLRGSVTGADKISKKKSKKKRPKWEKMYEEVWAK